jgi:hypothetical protein
MTFGTCNAGSLYRTGSLTKVVRELENYKWEYRRSNGTGVALNQQAVIKSRRKSWTGHVAHMVYRVLHGNIRRKKVTRTIQTWIGG